MRERTFWLYADSHFYKWCEKDVSDDMQMIVCGNSMQHYHIYDGQRIYVRKMGNEEKTE